MAIEKIEDGSLQTAIQIVASLTNDDTLNDLAEKHQAAPIKFKFLDN